MAATPRAPSTPVIEHVGRRAPFVSVAIRVKPSAPDDTVAIWAKPQEGDEPSRRVCCNRGYILEEYEFSRVFGPLDGNRHLFRELQGPALTASVFSGVSETLFAYGQTGSGKTHTIFGTGQEPGLLQLFVHSVFEQAEVFAGSTVHACCYEVLGDSLTDLIDAGPLIDRGQLAPEDVVYDELFIKTQKCRYQIVRVGCMATCLELLQDARENRASGLSSCNSTSSRSHAVVHLFVQNPANASPREGASTSSIGALTLVDLAGTEKEHENPSEQGRKCARLLNTSLSSLNRLLRKLQMGALDESERRQSVLNKCLWDYLKPGCGIALIFCVSPLLRHRATTLSTLAMATDSKLIHSQRKSQFIQVPAIAQSHPSTPSLCSQGPSSPRTSTCRYQGPGAPVPPHLPGDRTPRGGQTPRRPRSATSHASMRAAAEAESHDLAWQARARMADLSGTPRGAGTTFGGTPRRPSVPAFGTAAFTAPLVQPPPPQAPPVPACDPAEMQELEQLTGCDLRSAAGLKQLALEHSKLRRKLSRSRARSQERLSRYQREREQLSAENSALAKECESLRSLFIRQQQQQIAFWTGPFMEVIATKDVGAAAAASKARDRGLDSTPSSPNAAKASAETAVDDALFTGRALVRTPSAIEAEDARALRRERDYWRLLATDLKREMKECTALTRMRGGLQESDLSTSQSQQEGVCSERSHSGGTHWSDSGSELSIR